MMFIIFMRIVSMNKEELKKYFEELARKTLCLFVDSEYSKLNLEDKPDLQSLELNCGIEVRECKDEYDGRADAFLRMYFDKNNDDSFMQDKLKEMKLNSWLYRCSETRGLVFCTYDGLSDMNERKKKIAEYIREKSKKFDGYKKFQLNGLYLFCRWPFEEWDIKEVIDYISFNNFDVIFFDCMDCIFKYDVKSNNLCKIDYDMAKYCQLLDSLKHTYNLK